MPEGELSAKVGVGLGRHQIIGRIVFSKRFAHVFNLMRQKPGSETDRILRLVVNDTSSRQQKRESFVGLQKAADLRCTMVEAGEIRVCHNHIRMAS